jgi:predicted HAD superfamily Cof-like phosphohydrolase
MSFFRDVLDFHRKFAQVIGAPEEQKARIGSQELVKFRLSLIKEELSELEEALEAGDLVETADALADLIYVTIGTAIAFGIDLRPVWYEVQKSNMAKEGGATRADGKLLKPAGWKPPNIELALEQGEDLTKLGQWTI